MQKPIHFLIIIFLFNGIATAQKNFTLEQVILDTASFSPKKLMQLQWIPETDNFSYVTSNDGKEILVKENSTSEGKETILTLSKLNVSIQSAGLSIFTSFPIFKWISNNSIRFWVNQSLVKYNLKINSLTVINDIAVDGINTDYNNPHKIAYTINNNLFIAVNSNQIQITNEDNKAVVSGQAVHRNEFGITKGTFWSPKNNYLAYYKKDESMVTDYPLLDVGKRPAVIDNIKYPMAGMSSEEVSVGVYNLKTKKTIWLKTSNPKDNYLPGVTWSPDERYIYIAELNRDQNKMKLTKYNAKSGKLVKVLFEESNDKYIEPMNGLIFFDNEPDMFIWTTRNDGWNHLYLYDAQGAKIKQLTKGNWEVTGFDGLSKIGYNIFFTATEQGPLERHYYKIDLDRYKMTRITQGKGTHKVIRNEKGTMFLDIFNSVDVPYKVSVLDKNGEKLREVYSSNNPLDGYSKVKTELFTLKSNDGQDLYCRKILPADFDQSKKYPVLVYVYGGPHRQKVTNSWLSGEDLWLKFMAQKGFIVFTLDNRGSYNRGLEFEQTTFGHLGTVEIEDQLIGINYLKSLPYVDADRMGVYGRSFGGFMAIGLMTRTPGAFQVAVANAGVIDWQYYEVMYTERYMDTPQMNPKGYEEANLLNYIKDLKGKLLLVHGTDDPIVVWQQSLLYIKKAMQLGIEMDYFPYVGHEHKVNGKDRIHLFKKITDYVMENLKLK